MVLVFVFVFEPFLAIPEIDLSCQACIADNCHCAVNGGNANSRVLFSDDVVKVADCGMSFSFEEYIQNPVPLFAVEQAFTFQVLAEDCFSCFHILTGND